MAFAVGRRLVAEFFLVHAVAVGDGAAGEVVIKPVHVLADVGDPGMQPEGFGHITTQAVVECEGDGVGQKRFSGEQAGGESLGHLDALECRCRFRRRALHLGIEFVLGHGRGGDQQPEECLGHVAHGMPFAMTDQKPNAFKR